MRCPIDDAPLREVSRRGVQIDICPECKGVWLDRGELDKLIAVAEDEEVVYERSTSRSRRDDDDDDDDDDRRRSYSDDRDRRPSSDDRDYRRGAPTQQKKKKGWLSQMMEMAGGEGAED